MLYELVALEQGTFCQCSFQIKGWRLPRMQIRILNKNWTGDSVI